MPSFSSPFPAMLMNDGDFLFFFTFPFLLRLTKDVYARLSYGDKSRQTTHGEGTVAFPSPSGEFLPALFLLPFWGPDGSFPPFFCLPLTIMKVFFSDGSFRSCPA